MDPRLLLDPRGFAKAKASKRMPNYGPQQSRKPKSTGPTDFIQEPPPNDSKQISTFDTTAPHAGADKRPADDGAEEGREYSGVGSMIERLKNVNTREDAPVRKRKSDDTTDSGDDDRARKKANATSHGTFGGGIIGEHMKAERKRNAANIGPPNIFVDLTNDADADDEVQFVKENVNDEVCLGIFHGKVNLHRIPVVSQSAVGGVGKDYWPRTKLNYSRQTARDIIVNLYDRLRNNVGNLNPQLGHALCPLLDNSEKMKLKLKIWLESRPRTAGDVPGKRVSEYHTVTMFIYSRRQYAVTIGKHLSQNNIFLSQPPLNPGVEFFNPQLPRTYGQPARNGERKAQTYQSNISRTAEEMKRDADSMFDNLLKQEDLIDMDPNSDYIATPLLAHQKQALDFLAKHEQSEQNDGAGLSGFSLWKHKVQPNGSQLWYNIITGHEVDKKPESARGGILADMMGLGKTLSILSLIAKTVSESSEFASEEPLLDMLGVDRNAKGTLIICPKSVMANWEEQIKDHAHPDKLLVYCYHGTSRTQDVAKLARYDIVLTTYQTVASEFTVKDRALSAIQWFRIVLDEAHQIRNSSTQVSKACCALHAQRRWAVTGTPVQNGLNDLGALIKFLRIQPFDSGSNWAQYIMAPFKNANVDVLKHLQLLVQGITLRRMKDKVDLRDRFEEKVRIDFTPAERKVYEKVAGDSRVKILTMTGGSDKLRGKSYMHVLKSIGQMRAICAHNLDMLPEDERKEILEGMNPDNAIAVDLGDEPGEEPDIQFITEKQAYETLHMMSDSDVDRCRKCDRKIGENAIDDSLGVDETDDEIEGTDGSLTHNGSSQDTIGFITPCYHLICPKCRDKHVAEIQPCLTADKRHQCPYCEAYVRFGLFQFTRSKLNEFIESRNAVNKGKGRKVDLSTYCGPSTKVRAMITDLKQSMQETAMLPPNEPPIRSVIFTGWTQYLDLIEVALEDHNIGFVRLDGTMSIKKRSAVLETFRSDPAITVLLVSIKAGGQGLNFTAASKVYMMEPQFNPGVEQQAIDRVHRLGQTRDVHIRHYIMTNSVEEGILKLQEKKEKLAKLSMEKKMTSSEAQAKQRLEDLKELFK